jgi:tRNA pseudouridine38-40 synthase
MRFAITIEYDGSNLVGWQRQTNGLSVQEVLEKTLFVLTGEKKTIQGAGRTDAGVHALGQIAHFDLKKTMKMDAIRDGLNFHIKKLYKKIKVSVLKVKKEKKDFHARFSAKQKTYVYKILDRRPPPAIEKKRVWHVKKKLDDKSMKKAARILVGKHDFTSFRSTECQAKSALKTIDSIKILRVREEIQIWIKARSFLHNQVRIIAGTLILVGKKKWKEKNIEQALKSKKRAAAGQTAPAEGLYLYSVKY